MKQHFWFKCSDMVFFRVANSDLHTDLSALKKIKCSYFDMAIICGDHSFIELLNGGGVR